MTSVDRTMRAIEVRPFAGPLEYRQMVDYFHDADDAFLRGMGVDRAKLPARDQWLTAVLQDHDRPNREKDRAYLAWVHDGVAIGHSSINRIEIDASAFIHLHIWSPTHRQAGLGSRLFELSVAWFVREFALTRLYCEPNADNPGPNRLLIKCGFHFTRRYRTVPGPINFEQDVNQYIRYFPTPGGR